MDSLKACQGTKPKGGWGNQCPLQAIRKTALLPGKLLHLYLHRHSLLAVS